MRVRILHGCGVLIVLAMYSAQAQTAASEKPPQNPFVGVRTTDTTKIPVQIGNYNYEIPANYFDMQPDPSCNAEAALLVAVLPDFKGRSEENSHEINFSVKQKVRRVTMLLEADRKRRDNAQERLKIWADVIEDNNGPFAKAEYPWHELEYRYHVGKRQRKFTHEQYRYYESGQLASQIECNIVGSVRSPGCSHSFIVIDLTVKIHYKLSRLPQWQEMQTKVRNLILSWETGKAKELKTICNE